jgi:non-heme chloroperoxidase
MRYGEPRAFLLVEVVPVENTARKSEKLIKDVKAIYYPGAPHGITATHIDQVNADLLAFLEKGRKSSRAA